MGLPAAVVRARYAIAAPDKALEHERSVRRRVGLAWGLTFLNALGFVGSALPIPLVFGKLITQGALPCAVIVALTVNRKIVLRPNVFLCIVTLLPAEAVLTALQPQYIGALYRTFRLVEFCAVLWLLTPWWGRRDLLLVRCHLKMQWVILSSVILGRFVAPGTAFNEGRRSGALWGIPATQVGHYAAVATGLTIVLWLCGQLPGRPTAGLLAAGAVLLVLTHTRTALVGLAAGILVAGLSLVVARARVRRLFAIGGAITAVVIMTLSGLITTWLARGQGTQDLANLTGRTKVWGPLLAFPRDRFQEIFGFGLSNSSFNGLPIDSNWLSSYQEQGLFGVAVCVAILLFLLVAAYFQPRGVHRALALFLVTYCLVSSFTEDGFTDATPYLLELTLAASLLVPSLTSRVRFGDHAEP
jgi:hypothetical protein